jgi:hypothetical protein
MSETLLAIAPPTPTERVQTYLYDNCVELLNDHVEDFHDPKKPLPSTVVLIPVAAHTESELILPAMQQYSLQNNCAPFAVCLLLNHPKGASGAEVEKSVAAVEGAKRNFPSMDIRYSTAEYEHPTIGRIRKDLWDAVLRVAHAEGKFAITQYADDILGINHDIDTVSIDPFYISTIQSHYQALGAQPQVSAPYIAPMGSRYTQVRHGLDMKNFPNISKGIWLADFASKMAYPTGAYEEGMVIPFTLYATRNGFEAYDQTYETEKFVPTDYAGIPGTRMQTSPRRYIDRLDENGFANLWTTESFGPNDECRVPQERKDIAPQRLDELLFDALPLHTAYYANLQVFKILEALNFGPEDADLAAGDAIFVDPKELLFQVFAKTLTTMSTVSRRILGPASIYPPLAEAYIPEMYDESIKKYQEYGFNLTPRELIL